MEDEMTKLKYRMDGKFRMPCKLADGTMQCFTLYLFSFLNENKYIGKEEHFHVLVLGDVKGKNNVLTRIESACTYGHLYGSQLCDCQFQLQEALIKISKNQSGICIYCLDQHGRGTGIVNHIKSYQIEQEFDLDTVQAHQKLGLPEDARNYDPIIAILDYFEVRGVRLMTNNPQRLKLFSDYGISVKRVRHLAPLNYFNKKELKIKKEKLGYLHDYEFENSIEAINCDRLAD